jgi:hypothetical protein
MVSIEVSQRLFGGYGRHTSRLIGGPDEASCFEASPLVNAIEAVQLGALGGVVRTVVPPG